jgi:TolA-binding protein
VKPRISKVRCPIGLEDHAVLARRGGLGSEERRQLAEHLRRCDVCRVTWDAAGAFDECGDVEVGDEDIVLRAMDMAMAAPPVAKRRFRGRALRSAVTACVLFATAAAAAAAGGRIAAYLRMTAFSPYGGIPAAAPAQSVAKVRSASRSNAPAAHEQPEAASIEVAEAVEEPSPGAPGYNRETAVKVPRSGASLLSGSVTPVTLRPEAALFVRAKEARSEGRTGEAIFAFRRLEREYPNSPEAIVSLVSVGELLAAASAWDEALASFDAYLRRAPSGPLAPEALAGRARVLAHKGLAAARADRNETHRP